MDTFKGRLYAQQEVTSDTRRWLRLTIADHEYMIPYSLNCQSAYGILIRGCAEFLSHYQPDCDDASVLWREKRWRRVMLWREMVYEFRPGYSVRIPIPVDKYTR